MRGAPYPPPMIPSSTATRGSRSRQRPTYLRMSEGGLPTRSSPPAREGLLRCDPWKRVFATSNPSFSRNSTRFFTGLYSSNMCVTRGAPVLRSGGSSYACVMAPTSHFVPGGLGGRGGAPGLGSAYYDGPGRRYAILTREADTLTVLEARWCPRNVSEG